MIETCLVDNKGFNEIGVDIIRFVRFWVKTFYPKYPILKSHGINKEDIEDKIYSKLCNKSKGSIISNIEKAFIKASNENFTMTYIQNYIKITTKNAILEEVKYLPKKPLALSLDISINNEETTLADIVSGGVNNELGLKELIELVPNKKYPYTVRIDNKIIPLTVHNLLYLLVSVDKVTLIYNNIYTVLGHKVGVTHGYKLYTEIKEYAKNYFIKYKELV